MGLSMTGQLCRSKINKGYFWNQSIFVDETFYLERKIKRINTQTYNKDIAFHIERNNEESHRLLTIG